MAHLFADTQLTLIGTVFLRHAMTYCPTGTCCSGCQLDPAGAVALLLL
jgi:hypothetical protein